MTDVLVSIIVVVYNEELHIAQCINSLLEQSYRLTEIIVVDDGSTDGTVELINSFKSVRLLKLNHQGKAPAVNRGAQEAKGEIIFFLDGDMYFEKDYVEKMITPILSGECIGTAHTDEYVANPENIWSECLQIGSDLPPNRRVNLSDNERREGSIVFRAIKREMFLSVGGFENIGYMDDQSLYPKLKQKALFVSEAKCYHYNPETLREVFSTGSWGGKSIVIRFGYTSFFSFFPIFSFFRALKKGFKMKKITFFIYSFVSEIGIFYGILKLLTGIDKTYGK